MAGRLHRSMVYLGLVDDEGDYDEHDEGGHAGYDDGGHPDDRYDREPERDVERTQVATRVVRRPERGQVRTLDPRSRVDAVSFDDAPVAHRAPEPRLSRITTLHPRNYNDARAIGEQFRAGVPVVMDVTDMDDADAKRLVDFAAGLTFGLRGRIEKVTRGVFLLSPEGVAVTLDDPGTGPVEGGFYNQS